MGFGFSISVYSLVIISYNIISYNLNALVGLAKLANLYSSNFTESVSKQAPGACSNKYKGICAKLAHLVKPLLLDLIRVFCR